MNPLERLLSGAFTGPGFSKWRRPPPSSHWQIRWDDGRVTPVRRDKGQFTYDPRGPHEQDPKPGVLYASLGTDDTIQMVAVSVSPHGVVEQVRNGKVVRKLDQGDWTCTQCGKEPS